MKILVACPIKDRGWAVPLWYAGIEAQGIDVDVLCLLTLSEDDTEAALKERGVQVIVDDEVGRRRHEIEGHHWGLQKNYEYMERLRNQLVDYAEANNYDYFFSLDSDIVLPPMALEKMLQFSIQREPGSVIAPAVNMTVHDTAWNTMSWVDRDRPSLAHRPVKHPKRGRADVVMAAMLLDRVAICEGSWVAHTQGEDVGFSLEAFRQGLKCYWLDDIRCEHMMRPRLCELL